MTIHLFTYCSFKNGEGMGQISIFPWLWQLFSFWKAYMYHEVFNRDWGEAKCRNLDNTGDFSRVSNCLIFGSFTLEGIYTSCSCILKDWTIKCSPCETEIQSGLIWWGNKCFPALLLLSPGTLFRYIESMLKYIIHDCSRSQLTP